MAQVFLGMSGGVDSSAAAVLLQEQGYAVSGLHLSLLSGLPLPADRLPDDGSDARAVASLLGLPFYDMDLSPEFRATVIDYFIREYEMGRTPNPCVFCNRRIKFGAMWDAAQKLGADYLPPATTPSSDRILPPAVTARRGRTVPRTRATFSAG